MLISNGVNRFNCVDAGRRSVLKAGLLAMSGLMFRGIAVGKLSSADITATFSIVAVDPDSGVCGAAVASKYPAVGRVVPYVRADVGAFCTQHYHVQIGRAHV